MYNTMKSILREKQDNVTMSIEKYWPNHHWQIIWKNLT
jgi:hypothetical protein